MSAQPPSSQPSAVLQECLDDARREARLIQLAGALLLVVLLSNLAMTLSKPPI